MHSFDYFGWLTGSPAVRVTAMAADSGAGPGTYCLATVRYADDTIARAEVSWAHPPSRGFKLAAELVGTEGRLTWDYDHLMGGVFYPREGEPEWYDVLSDRGFTVELRAFTDAIRAGGHRRCRPTTPSRRCAWRSRPWNRFRPGRPST